MSKKKSRNYRDRKPQEVKELPLYRELSPENWEEVPKEEKIRQPKESKIDYYIGFYI